jgi:hypothetical protein
VVFAFNRTVDDYLLTPVARGYTALPDFAQQGVHNFASNFGEPKVFANDLLQGNGERAMTSLTRFIFNTTLGVAGWSMCPARWAEPTPLGLRPDLRRLGHRQWPHRRAAAAGYAQSA